MLNGKDKAIEVVVATGELINRNGTAKDCDAHLCRLIRIDQAGEKAA